MTLQPRRHAAVAAVSLLGALVAPLLLVAVTSAQVIPPIAPPKPAVVRNPNATSIGTGDLAEALAKQGRTDESISALRSGMGSSCKSASRVRSPASTQNRSRCPS